MTAASTPDLAPELARIAEGDAEVGAFAVRSSPEAVQRERTRSLQAGGPLQGVLVGVKDIFDSAALPTAYGSPVFAGHQPRTDAAIIQSIRRAGGVLAGKTTTTEFAFLNPTATRNPNAPGHTPGGSSAGSAAAVAAGLLPLAVGTQTGGSVIRPASYCGVVGFKPSFGLLPTPGLKCFSWSLDTVGLFTASVADMARFGQAISGHRWESPASTAPVFGIAWDHPWEPLSPSARLALQTAVARLREAGATVRELTLPSWLGPLFKAHDAVQGWEAARALADEYEFHADALSPILRDYLAGARQVGDAGYEAGQAVARSARSQAGQLFDGVDVILTASAPDEPPAGLGSTGASTWNRAWTLLGVPCLNVPGAHGVNGLPMGVQLVAPAWQEATCLRAGALLEAALRQ